MQQTGSRSSPRTFVKRLHSPRFIFTEEKDYLIENLAMLMSAGMDVIAALKAIQVELRSSRMKRMLTQLQDEIEAGSSIWRALDKIGFFPQHVISLIRIGEKAGKLSDNLKVIVEQQQKDRAFRSKIYSAMMYPVLVLSLTLIIGIGIAWFILPRLALVFASLDIELPLISRILIRVGSFIGSYGLYVIPIFIGALAIIVYSIFVSRHMRFIGQKILFSIPAVKKLIQEVELARAGYILGTLLSAGLSIVDALRSLADASTISSYRKFYRFLRERVEEGNSLQRSFKEHQRIRKLIPTPIQQMVVAAEQSGNLSETLLRIGEIYEAKTEITTKNIVVILEPLLLIIVWIGVVAVAIAVILPIYNLIGGIDQF